MLLGNSHLFFDFYRGSSEKQRMDATNGNDVDGGISPVPADAERIVILDAGAQYGKVRPSFCTKMS